MAQVINFKTDDASFIRLKKAGIKKASLQLAMLLLSVKN
jgi:hypothetical protein